MATNAFITTWSAMASPNAEKRIKLAFVCLMTAVGLPMILAGDEFADEHDLDITDEHSDRKQVDPVNYSRMNDGWRKRIFDYVARLVASRSVDQTSHHNARIPCSSP